jgi:putative polyketide hydroxylase
MNASHDVVVVGAGPAGLVTAIVLAQHGADVLVLDQRTRPSALPRAVGVTLRQMEVFRSWGLEEKLRAGSSDVELTALETRTAAEAGSGATRDLNVPDARHSEVVSPTAPHRVPQDHLEMVLLEHLGSLPTAKVRRGVEVTGLDQSDEGVRLHTSEGTVAAAYAVGADGHRSTVRDALGIAVEGTDAAMAGVATEFRAPLWPHLGGQRHALYLVQHPDAGGVLIPAGGDRWQYGVVLGPDDDAEAVAQLPTLIRRIRTATGVPGLPVQVTRVSAFRAGAQLAERFGDGRVHLVGDAAHRVTPRGGNGLAMAVRDGLALGWRLAWVLRGWAPPGFLGGYEQEQRPLAVEDVARAADPQGSCDAVITEMLHDLGGRLQHAWVGPGTSTLDLIGQGMTLLVADNVDGWRRAAASVLHRVPFTLAELPPTTSHALGLHRPGGAVLVRPDGVPVARWWRSVDPSADLDRAVTDLFSLGTDVPHLQEIA